MMSLSVFSLASLTANVKYSCSRSSCICFIFLYSYLVCGFSWIPFFCLKNVSFKRFLCWWFYRWDFSSFFSIVCFCFSMRRFLILVRDAVLRTCVFPFVFMSAWFINIYSSISFVWFNTSYWLLCWYSMSIVYYCVIVFVSFLIWVLCFYFSLVCCLLY